jgi:hypothetical protein
MLGVVLDSTASAEVVIDSAEAYTTVPSVSATLGRRPFERASLIPTRRIAARRAPKQRQMAGALRTKLGEL